VRRPWKRRLVHDLGFGVAHEMFGGPMWTVGQLTALTRSTAFTVGPAAVRAIASGLPPIGTSHVPPAAGFVHNGNTLVALATVTCSSGLSYVFVSFGTPGGVFAPWRYDR
jgi:hypothetical protein